MVGYIGKLDAFDGSVDKWMIDAQKDRLVCGLLKESIQKRLLTDDKLTFKRAVEIAVSLEATPRDAIELESGAKNGVLITAAERMQRWALFLGGQRLRIFLLQQR
ncbi:hypothetical protein AOLI_G00229500 [Acnodon oligacanthus]